MCVKAAAILNALAALAFAALLVIGSAQAKLNARISFTQLDRAGVINAQALGTFDASYGFGGAGSLEYRTTVPVWICDTAISRLQETATLGVYISAINVILAVVALVRQRRRASPTVLGARA